jgi:hypothetical protein
MDFLNSQHLTPHDGYAHPFHKPGEFTYSALLSDMNKPAESGTIIVAGEGVAEGKGKQYDIVFHWDAAARRFMPRESDMKLTIRPNDFVVFQFDAAVPGQPPCFILIQGKESVEGDSRRLKTHDVYTHFFLSPGEYAYRLEEAAYRISVADHRSMSEADEAAFGDHGQWEQHNVPHGRIVASSGTFGLNDQRHQRVGQSCDPADDHDPNGCRPLDRRPPAQPPAEARKAANRPGAARRHERPSPHEAVSPGQRAAAASTKAIPYDGKAA